MFSPTTEWDPYAPVGLEQLIGRLPERVEIEGESCRLKAFPRPSYVSLRSGKPRPLWPGFLVSTDPDSPVRDEILVRELADRSTEATRTVLAFSRALAPENDVPERLRAVHSGMRSIIGELDAALPRDVLRKALEERDASPVCLAFENIARRVPWSARSAWAGVIPSYVGRAFRVRLSPLVDPHWPTAPQHLPQLPGTPSVDAVGTVFTDDPDPAEGRHFAYRTDGEWHVLDASEAHVLPFRDFAAERRIVAVDVRRAPAG